MTEPGNRDRREIAAFFDVDGTLLKSNVVEYLVYFQRRRLPRPRFVLWCLGLGVRVPLYLAVDAISRSWFCRWFYRSYRGMADAELRGLARRLFVDSILPRLYRAALERVDWHRQQGHRVVLLTGSLDFIMRPLAEHLKTEDLLAASLGVEQGKFTGELSSPPLTEAGKAEAVFRFSRSHQIDYRQSYAYGDSISDLPMLECVGHPHAVNPDRRLTVVARAKGWPVVRWTVSN